jgi:pimeloyl-ACP methyl ester carboxylesterase
MSGRPSVPGMVGRFVETHRRVMHVWTSGGGDPAVLLHGFTDDGSCWVGAAPLFTSRGFRVIAPDARAHGRTPLLADDDFTAIARRDDAASLMASLDVGGALVVGHSMGAITAMQLAAQHSGLARAVVLIDPPLGDVDLDEQRNRENPFETWLAEITAMETSALIDLCRQENPTWTLTEVDAWVASKQAVDQDLFRRPQSWVEGSWRVTLDAIEVPVLLVAGEPRLGSTVDEGAGRWLAEHPRIQFTRIAGAGHSVHRDAAAEFAAIVGGFLESRL